MQIKPGTVIVGKWSGARIAVGEHIGTGANGEVYLVRYQGKWAAMKVSSQSGDIALEWAILERLAEYGRLFPQPILADDVTTQDPCYFYVMEWVPGEPFTKVFKTLEPVRQCIVLQKILQGLAHLHGTGHAFCDVKPENILVQVQPQLSVRFIDVGGVTPFGRSVRQFTPLYDRAFWQLGSRQSEPSYDMAAVALLFLCTLRNQTLAGVQSLSTSGRQQWLEKSLGALPVPTIRPILRDMMLGKRADAATTMDAIGRCDVTTVNRGHRRQGPRTSASSQPNPGRVASTIDWTERVMWVSLVTAFSVTCVAVVSVMGWL